MVSMDKGSLPEEKGLNTEDKVSSYKKKIVVSPRLYEREKIQYAGHRS